MNEITPWLKVAETFGYPVAMASFLLCWSYIRDKRAEKRDSAREARMWEEIKRSRDKSNEISEGAINRNTEALEGMKNYLNHTGNIVQNCHLQQQEWKDVIKKCHARNEAFQELTPPKQRAIKEKDGLVSPKYP